jgi:hypothetical protein
MRNGGFILLVGMVLVGAACGQPADSPVAQEELLFLRTARGITVASAGGEEPNFRSSTAVPSGDWSTAVSAEIAKNSTILSAAEPSTGRSMWERSLDGRLQVKVVSYEGDYVALGPVDEWHHTVGRAKTDLVIAASNGYAPPQSLTLDGNYEPEAFSSDGKNLFVIEYLPARNPVNYRVRSLDLTTGEVGGVYTPHDELQEAMGGTARVQALAPDGGRLYTLYTERLNGHTHTFVHVLSLDEKWAHCIDLPDGFAEDAEAATALTLSPDGSRLFVANSSTDNLAEVDTEALQVVKAEGVEFTDDRGTRFAHGTHVAEGGDNLYLAGEHGLSAVDAATLEPAGEWVMEEPITGLQLSDDGSKLYVGQKAKVVVLDVDSGEELESIDPPGIEKIDLLGQSTKTIDLLGGYKCGC